MEASKIPDLDLLDIIFEGRNKEYGAYDLRKTYNKRLIQALGAVGALCFLLFLGWELSKRPGSDEKQTVFVDTVTLEQVVQKRKIDPPLVLPRPRIVLPKPAITRFVRPLIVKDELVKEEDRPPEQQTLDETKIGTINQVGVKGVDIIDPPVSEGGGSMTGAPKQDENTGSSFIPVEMESEYPGGAPAWQRYLNKEFRYPDEAVNGGIEGVVEVQFIVDKEGNVSDVQAVSGPAGGGLREEAVRVIKKSGKWTPAIQNGRQVKSYKRQSIVFRLNTE